MTQPRSDNGQFGSAPGAPAEVSLRPNLIELSEDAERILAACREAGGHPLIVGGAVRDALATDTREPKDLDIEVYNVSGLKVLIPYLRKVGKVDEVGASFGVLKVWVGDSDYDVAVPRTESKSGAGHRGFEVEIDPHLSYADALARRDFTMNSIGYIPTTGEIIDPYNGRGDLADGVLRHTSDAFSDDPLRVLRAAQFAARYDLVMAPETVELARSISPRFSELATERVHGEFVKLAHAPKPSAGLRVLRETGWLEHFPELANTVGVQQDERYHPEGDVFEHQSQAADAAARAADERGLERDDRTVIVMAAMLHDVGKATHTQYHEGRITSHGHADAGAPMVVAFLARAGFSKDIQDRVRPLVREHMNHAAAGVGNAPSDSAIRALVRRLEPATIEEWAMTLDADAGGRGPASRAGTGWSWVERAEAIGSQRPNKALLRGEHLMAEGMKPGPEFAPHIRASLEAQDNGEFADEVGAVAWLRARLG